MYCLSVYILNDLTIAVITAMIQLLASIVDILKNASLHIYFKRNHASSCRYHVAIDHTTLGGNNN